MKKSAILLMLIHVAVYLNAQSSASFDFNTPNQLIDEFNQGGSASNITQSTNTGIGSTGAINITNVSTHEVFVTKQGYSNGGPGSVYVFSTYFKSVWNNGYGGLGFTTDANATHQSYAYATNSIGISVHGGGYVFNSGTTTRSGSWNSSISDLLNSGSTDDWYKVIFTIEQKAGSVFDLTCEVYPAYANGSLIDPSLPPVPDAVQTTSFTNTTMANASIIYAYFAFGGQRISDFDNYEINLDGSTVVGEGEPVVIGSAALSSGNIDLSGEVTDDRGAAVTDRGFVWSNAESLPTTSNSTVIQSGSGTGTFSSQITSPASDTFYIRAYATNTNGTSYGVPDTVIIPPPLNILQFDGVDDYVDVASDDSLDITSALTIEAWINTTDTINSQVIVGKMAAGGNCSDVAYALRINNNGIRFEVGNGTNCYSSPTYLMKRNEWYYVTGYFDGANSKVGLYINGRLIGETSASSSLRVTTTPLSIGRYNSTYNQYFEGKIEELRIWSDVRTQDEIVDNMCKELTGSESNLVVHYNFNQDSGSSLSDQTSNNLNGAMNNMDDSDWVGADAFNTWLGESTDWFDTDNWLLGVVPGIGNGGNIGIYTVPNMPSIVAPINIDHLIVSTSSSISLNNNITVNGNLILESDLDLNGRIITLGSDGYLMEHSGRLTGATGNINITTDLNNINAENIGGLGAEITTINNMGSTTVIRKHNVITNGSGGNSILMNYDISPTNNSDLDATLVFHYEDADLNGNTEGDLVLFKSSDGGITWDKQLASVVNTSNNTITLSGLSGFSAWTSAESSAVLPVELIRFDIIPGDNHEAYLNWTTISEKDNSQFEIERSFDGRQFEAIGIIQGKGNSVVESDYSFIDKNIPAGRNEVYYRLKQIDFKGTYSYSEIKAVRFESVLAFEAYPNPVKGNLNLKFNNYKGEISLKLSQTDGTVVYYKTMELDSSTENYLVNMDKFAPGVYILSVILGEEYHSLRIIKD